MFLTKFMETETGNFSFDNGILFEDFWPGINTFFTVIHIYFALAITLIYQLNIFNNGISYIVMMSIFNNRIYQIVMIL